MAVVLLLGAAGALRAQEAPPADDRYVFAASGGHEARVSSTPRRSARASTGRTVPAGWDTALLGVRGRRANAPAVRVELRAGSAVVVNDLDAQARGLRWLNLTGLRAQLAAGTRVDVLVAGRDARARAGRAAHVREPARPGAADPDPGPAPGRRGDRRVRALRVRPRRHDRHRHLGQRRRRQLRGRLPRPGRAVPLQGLPARGRQRDGALAGRRAAGALLQPRLLRRAPASTMHETAGARWCPSCTARTTTWPSTGARTSRACCRTARATNSWANLVDDLRADPEAR